LRRKSAGFAGAMQIYDRCRAAPKRSIDRPNRRAAGIPLNRAASSILMRRTDRRRPQVGPYKYGHSRARDIHAVQHPAIRARPWQANVARIERPVYARIASHGGLKSAEARSAKAEAKSGSKVWAGRSFPYFAEFTIGRAFNAAR